MGKAIKLPGSLFAGANLGTVTELSDAPVQSLAIIGDDTVVGTQDAATYTVSYLPSNTYQRGVVWSIDSGGEYATIDASTGVLTILAGAALSSVTIKATSSYNVSVYATKVVVVSFTADNIWDAALADQNFSQYMTGMTKLYENAEAIVKNGSALGNAITQPITSLTQNFVVLIDVTIGTNAANAAIVSRIADNFGFGYVNSAWWIGGNWPPNKVTVGFTESRSVFYIFYDRTAKTLYVKNATSGVIKTASNVTGSGTLRTEAYIGGGATSQNNFVGTIHKIYIGG